LQPDDFLVFFLPLQFKNSLMPWKERGAGYSTRPKRLNFGAMPAMPVRQSFIEFYRLFLRIAQTGMRSYPNTNKIMSCRIHYGSPHYPN
jgi:hypothetical protein